MKKWARRIFTGLLALLLIVALAAVIDAKLSGGTPTFMGYEIMNVLSGSMEPEIRTGSVIAVRPGGDMSRFAAGDVISFRSVDHPDMIITHRIVEVRKSDSGVQYVTKGDANDAQDPLPVPESHVIGEYAGITVPLLGYLFAFIKSKAGIILFMIVPGASLIISQFVSVWRMIAALDEGKERAEAIDPHHLSQKA